MPQVRGYAAALEHLFADDAVVMVPGLGVMTKAGAVGMVTSGRMKFDREETSETKFRVYDTTAIVTGCLRRARAIGGTTGETTGGLRRCTSAVRAVGRLSHFMRRTLRP
jgi:Domain of unknown function (DUF4440)